MLDHEFKAIAAAGAALCTALMTPRILDSFLETDSATNDNTVISCAPQLTL